MVLLLLVVMAETVLHLPLQEHLSIEPVAAVVDALVDLPELAD